MAVAGTRCKFGNGLAMPEQLMIDKRSVHDADEKRFFGESGSRVGSNGVGDTGLC
jgi:hypothetical protein